MKEVKNVTEADFARDIGLWEVDVAMFEVMNGLEALTLFIVDKGSYFIHAMRMHGEDDDVSIFLKKAIEETLLSSPFLAKKLLFKKNSKFLQILTEIADSKKIPYELVTSFKAVPQIKRDVKNYHKRTSFFPEGEEEFLGEDVLSPYKEEAPPKKNSKNSPKAPFDIGKVPFTNPTSSFDTVYQFKISLKYSKPLIWRRVQVPKTYTFFELYVAIECALGWAGGHLHDFSIAQKGTARPLSIKIPHPAFGEDFFGEESLNELEEKIADYFGKTVQQCGYMYDFGDSWDHTVLFEGEFPRDTKVTYPLCLDGKNACPFEDCGGLGGYYNLQEVLKNKKDAEYKDTREWLGLEEGEEFVLEDFIPGEVFFDDPKERLQENIDGGYFEV